MEEGQNLVFCLLDEINANFEKIIFDKHIQSELVKFTVESVKNTLIDLLEVRFIYIKWRFFKLPLNLNDIDTYIADIGLVF